MWKMESERAKVKSSKKHNERDWELGCETNGFSKILKFKYAKKWSKKENIPKVGRVSLDMKFFDPDFWPKKKAFYRNLKTHALLTCQINR